MNLSSKSIRSRISLAACLRFLLFSLVAFLCSFQPAAVAQEHQEATALQTFKFKGDPSSKWQVYEVAEQDDGLLSLLPENSGNICKNQEFHLGAYSEGLFCVVEYKSEATRSDFARVFFVRVSAPQKGTKVFKLTDACTTTKTVLIDDYQERIIELDKPTTGMVQFTSEKKQKRRKRKTLLEFEMEVIQLAYVAAREMYLQGYVDWVDAWFAVYARCAGERYFA